MGYFSISVTTCDLVMRWANQHKNFVGLNVELCKGNIARFQ